MSPWRPTAASFSLFLFVHLSRRRFRHPIGNYSCSVGISGGLPPFSLLLTRYANFYLLCIKELIMLHPCMHLLYLTSELSCEYIQSTHWLATGYFIGQAWKNMNTRKSSLVMIVRARTLPSQNACRVKADGMGPSYRRRFPLRSYTPDLTIMVIIYVRRRVWM